jgi:TP901 family phage tail tape measure protein
MAVEPKRKVKIEIGSSASGMDKGLNEARRKLRAFEREKAKKEKEQERDRKRAAKAAVGFAGGVANGLAAAAGIDLAGGISGIASEFFDTEREMTRFQIDAQLSNEQMKGFRAELLRVSDATGQSREALIKGAHAYQILTGDANGAIASSQLFAEVANASGANMEDIAATAASMRKNMGFDPSDFRKGFDVLLSMGHKGSVELRDFATELSGIAPQFKDFGDKSTMERWTELAAAAQAIRNNFADASEMSTGFRAAMTAISKSKVANKLEGLGVKVWEIDPKTKQHVKRDFFDIVADIHDKIKDKKILADTLGGRQESLRAISAILDHYEEMVALKREAAGSDQVAKDNQTWMESSAGRLALAWEHIKNIAADVLTPERVDEFAKSMVELAGVIRQVADGLSEAIDDLEKFLGLNPNKEAREIIKDTKAQGPEAVQKYIDETDKLPRKMMGMDAFEAEHIAADYMRSYPKGFAPGGVMGRVNLPWNRGATPDVHTVVKVGANNIVKAHGSAPTQRTRPGGR